MSETRAELMEDQVVAILRLALMQAPSFGAITIIVKFKEDKAVFIESSILEQHKMSEVVIHAAGQD